MSVYETVILVLTLIASAGSIAVLNDKMPVISIPQLKQNKFGFWYIEFVLSSGLTGSSFNSIEIKGFKLLLCDWELKNFYPIIDTKYFSSSVDPDFTSTSDAPTKLIRLLCLPDDKASPPKVTSLVVTWRFRNWPFKKRLCRSLTT